MRRSLLLLFATLLATSHGWLSSMTRRDMFGTTWTAVVALADPKLTVDVQNKNATSQAAETEEEQRRKKREQQEQARIARETKARLAAGRIGTI